MTKREFLAAGLGAGFTSAAFAQHPAKAAAKAPTRMAKTTKLFKSPQGFPNAVSVTPEGLWIAEQKLSGALFYKKIDNPIESFVTLTAAPFDRMSKLAPDRNQSGKGNWWSSVSR